MNVPELYVGNRKVPNIVKITPVAEPTFGEGTARETLDGHFSGTFIGYFTVLEVEIGPSTQAEYKLIKSILEHPFLSNVRYRLERDMNWVDENNVEHNLNAGDFYTENFYNGAAIRAPQRYDLSVEGFTVTLTAIDRRPIFE